MAWSTRSRDKRKRRLGDKRGAPESPSVARTRRLRAQSDAPKERSDKRRDPTGGAEEARRKARKTSESEGFRASEGDKANSDVCDAKRVGGRETTEIFFEISAEDSEARRKDKSHRDEGFEPKPRQTKVKARRQARKPKASSLNVGAERSEVPGIKKHRENPRSKKIIYICEK